MNRKIKSMMVEKGVKQVDIARALGITRGTVSGAISGYHRSDPVMNKLAELLKTDIDKLDRLWSKAA